MMKRSRILPTALAMLALLALWAAACRGRPCKDEALIVYENPLLAWSPAETHTDDLDLMARRKTVRVLTTLNRTSFFLDDGRPRGFEYQLLEGWIHELNEENGQADVEVRIEWHPVSHDKLIPYLLEGKGDIAAAALTVTEARLRAVDFTTPYLDDLSEVVVAHRDVQGLEGADSLSGRRVFVRPSSSYSESLEELNERFRREGKKPVVIEEASEVLGTEDILELVDAGIVDITVADSSLASLWSKVLPNIRVHAALTLRSDVQNAWMVRKDSPLLKKSLNEFIEKHRRGTLMGNMLFKRYYQDTRWVRKPPGRERTKKLGTYEPLFKKYGEKYGIDWRLIAAQAFQESGLNNDAESPAGAIGVMQVLPSLGEDRRIQIRDLHLPENNIHAGVKYLALLRDSYFSGEGMEGPADMRLSLAAYNAGPARILKARARAEQMGYDPAKWFDNTEHATLAVAGQEPVRYVSNIYKYYVAYVAADELKKTRQAAKERLRKSSR